MALHTADAVLVAPSADILEHVDLLRLDAGRRLKPDQKSALGQYFTPPSVARLMASMARCGNAEVTILDAGAGVGSLFAALVESLCQRPVPPASIHVTAYEVDQQLAPYLSATLTLCERACAQRGIAFAGEVVTADFLASAVHQVRGDLFSADRPRRFNCAILNPPYRKIHSRSGDRRRLRQLGIETSNLYTGFVAAAMQLLAPEGELVAITPRSFCNGPYFRPFREALLSRMTIRRLHVFESRQQAFSDDDVLQENIILHAISTSQPPQPILVTSSEGPDDEWFTAREMRPDEVVQPGDPQRFIHLVPDAKGQRIRQQAAQLPSLLRDLGLSVSTGRVVDFRAAPYLRALPGPGTAPLIYPSHLTDGYVDWPRPKGRKPNALVVADPIRDQFVPNGTYVLVKRFSAKEERRRIVAAIHDSAHAPGPLVAFENHLNYFHREGKPLPRDLAYGLAAFLNSSLVDAYFRQFNGHTQVNATDLRSMRYPSLPQLERLGQAMARWLPTQAEIDQAVERELATVAEETAQDQAQIQRRLQEALDIIAALELPAAQRNERSALTLLALLDLGPGDPWSSATATRLGITPMMSFFARRYGRQYAPNTRETVRRQTVHQFVDAGLLIVNPDDPSRPVNSPHTVYEFERGAVDLFRSYGTPEWASNLQTYLASLAALRQMQRDERRSARIPVTLPSGRQVSLSAGGQNTLIRLVVEEFAPRFTPGGEVLYLGDAEEKWAVFEQQRFVALGVQLDPHGKMPDVVIYHPAKNWLVLVEAVTSHGPMDALRQRTLATLFAGASAGLVFVTAFLDRRAMAGYLPKISWETEVWVADAPSHLIHFDGERFLGPHGA
jgi:adenine-specific DNA-methyltransferase